ncbi:MAG: hypothetical protein HY831_00335 [Candidatus Aenigmarchaeota archaeon]|nr:hypothetical protein [Candidatus Aenigmarchaeota archaeon]
MMKGTSGYFIFLSIIGIIVGIAMILVGFGGNGLSAPIVIILGFFVLFKEILDLFH